MRGDNHLLAVTTSTDPITNEVKPLFAFPIQVCKATEAGADQQFQAAAPSGAEYDVKYVDKATGETFEYDQRLRGVRLSEDDFRAIPADSIAEIDEATKIKTMVALGHAPLRDVRSKYGDRVTGVYFIQSPKGGSPKAYRLTYEALRGDEAAGRPAMALVTKRTARSRQKLCFIYSDEDRGCLVMNEVTFAAALREPDAMVLAPQQATVEQKQIDMARQVIDAMPDGLPVLDDEHDEAVPMRKSLIEKAVDGEAIIAPVKPVVESIEEESLEDALTASLEAFSAPTSA